MNGGRPSRWLAWPWWRLSVVLGACGGDDQGTTSASATAAADQPAPRPTGGRPLVVTTVAPITSIVASIVGERAEVVGIVPEGTNSHTFEPQPSSAKVLAAG